jgi:nitrite reductase/ring-hydroxylating ferredoxin subunit
MTDNASPSAWHKVAVASSIPDGAVQGCSVAGISFVLTRVGNTFGAVTDRCPHAGGPLAQGTLENGRLVCPWHGREYDPVTGTCHGYADSLRCFPVEVRDDEVYVSVTGA